MCFNSGHALNKKESLNKIVGGVFAASVKSLVPTWQSVKQVLWRASFMAVTFTSRSVGRLSERLEREEGNNHDKFIVSLLLFPESFRGCFGTSSGTE